MSNYSPEYNISDRIVLNLEAILQTLCGKPEVTRDINFQAQTSDLPLTQAEQRVSAGLMRVNHSGEVCAQALYNGQAVFARDPEVQKVLLHSAYEENDHLNWCKTRLEELHSSASIFNPLWYAGSWALGSFAGLCGDKWSLGFIAETENQVAEHLESHLQRLPRNDTVSRNIVSQMKIDETAHETVALENGGAALPILVKKAMRITSKIMTTLSFYY